MNSMQKADSSSWPNLLLPTLSVTIGMQCMRAFLAYLQYLLGDRLGLGAVQLGLVALAVFATGFLAAWLVNDFWRSSRFSAMTSRTSAETPVVDISSGYSSERVTPSFGWVTGLETVTHEGKSRTQ